MTKSPILTINCEFEWYLYLFNDMLLNTMPLVIVFLED
jgi:hypothetical protein